MRKSLVDSELLCVVPAGGKGTRLGKLTEHQVKPSVPVAFDPASGEVTRMIDVPLEAIRQLGGTALVTTHYAAHSLEFVDNYDHAERVSDDGYITPIDSMVRNRRLFEVSRAVSVGIVPADARISMDSLAGLCDAMTNRGVAAAMLATNQLAGHNTRPVNAHGIVVARGAEPDRRLADLGVHVFNKEWLLGRIDECGGGVDGSIDVWRDIYQIDDPVTDVVLYVPHDDRGWVDMGTPAQLQETIYALNMGQVDTNGNVVFPGAQLLGGSTRTVALPASSGLSVFHNAIIPENVTALTNYDVLEV